LLIAKVFSCLQFAGNNSGSKRRNFSFDTGFLREAISETPMSWKVVKMSVQDIAANKHAQLQNMFETIFIGLRAPKDAAMFGNKDIAKEYSYYFSPGAAKIIDLAKMGLQAVDCPKPARDSVALLVGHAGATDDLLK
jgi:hypothetical protein